MISSSYSSSIVLAGRVSLISFATNPFFPLKLLKLLTPAELHTDYSSSSSSSPAILIFPPALEFLLCHLIPLPLQLTLS